MLGKQQVEARLKNALHILEQAPFETVKHLWGNEESRLLLTDAIPYMSETRRVQLRFYFKELKKLGQK